MHTIDFIRRDPLPAPCCFAPIRQARSSGSARPASHGFFIFLAMAWIACIRDDMHRDLGDLFRSHFHWQIYLSGFRFRFDRSDDQGSGSRCTPALAAGPVCTFPFSSTHSPHRTTIDIAPNFAQVHGDFHKYLVNMTVVYRVAHETRKAVLLASDMPFEGRW